MWDRAAGLDVVGQTRAACRPRRLPQWIRRIWSTWMPSFSWSWRLICNTSSVGSKVMACLRPVSVLMKICARGRRGREGARGARRAHVVRPRVTLASLCARVLTRLRAVRSVRA